MEEKAMQQATHSRWAAFVERWDARLTRLKDAFDPTSRNGRPMKAWAIVALAAGLIVLAALIVFGVMWVVSHHKWVLFIYLFKLGKLFFVGLAIVLALVFRDRLFGGEKPEAPKK
jgi:uncharacterized membrane protein YcfT